MVLNPLESELLNKLLNDTSIESYEDVAYIMATIKHETANTFRPIKEYGLGRGHTYGISDLDTGQTYYGRGYVQLTWKENYQKFTDLLHIDLINDPDLALQPDTAYKIIVVGMQKGIFTGKKLIDYIFDKSVDFVRARRIINGMDQAQLIAGYANLYLGEIHKLHPPLDTTPIKPIVSTPVLQPVEPAQPTTIIEPVKVSEPLPPIIVEQPIEQSTISIPDVLPTDIPPHIPSILTIISKILSLLRALFKHG